MTKRLLIVEDDPLIADVIATVGRGAGFSPSVLGTSEELMSKVPGRGDIISLDLNLPGEDGIMVLRKLGETCPDTPVLINSGVDDATLGVALKFARLSGIANVKALGKPFATAKLRELLSELDARSEPAPRKPAPLGQRRDAFSEREVADASVTQFVPFFQPKVRLSDGSVYGFEMLARWEPAEGVVLSPNVFLPGLRSCQRLEEVSCHLFEWSMRQLREWQLNMDMPQLTCALNLEASLVRHETPDRLADMTGANELLPKSIVLELTEQELFRDRALGLEALIRLKLKSFRVSMDDFGTGYSSVERLTEFPFSEIKLDVGFVSRLGLDPRVDAIIGSVIELAGRIGAEVCAEGVERSDQYERLRALGCSSAQGYLIARPMSHRVATDWLADQLMKQHRATQQSA